MPALVHDIIIEQGATFQRRFTVTPVTGILDLDTCTLEGAIHDTNDNTLETFTCSAARSDLLISITHTDTALLPLPGDDQYWHYYVSATTLDGIVYRVAQGKVFISKK